MRRLLLLVSAVVLLDTMFYAAITPVLPEYSRDLDLSKSAAGILSASYAAGGLVGALPGGWLAARVGVRPTVIVGMGLLSASSVTFAFADSVLLLDSARFLQGIGGACSWAGGFAWLLAAAPEGRRGELIGTAVAAAVVGVLLGPVLGGAATVVGPEPVFTAVGVAGLGLAAWAFATRGAARSRPEPMRSVAAAVGTRPVLGAAWLVALPALFSGTLVVLAPLRLDDLGAGGVLVGAIFLGAAAIEAVLSWVLGTVSDRRGRMAPIRAGLLGATLMALLLPLPGTVALAAVAVVLAVAALGAFWSPAMALLSDAAEGGGLDQGYAFALVNLAWASGQVVGGAAGSRLADATSDAVPYLVLFVLCAATLATASPSRLIAARGS